jgi:hypothetical protein
VIDLRSGDVVHWVRFESLIREFYDVAVLKHCVRPMAIGFPTDEIRRAITIGGADGDPGGSARLTCVHHHLPST